MGKRIHAFVGNRVTKLQRPYNKEKLLPFWSHTIDNWYFVRKKFFRWNGKKWVPTWDGKIKYLKYDKVPSGLFWSTYQDIEKETKKQFIIHHRTSVPPFFPSSKWIKSEGKYEFQNDCVDAMLGATNRGMGGLILNATGSGKTRVAAMYASRVNCDILFVVDQLNLLEQAREDISRHLRERVGKVGESKFKLRRVTVATRQTLALHLKDEKFKKWFRKVRVQFIDEIHEQMNQSNFDILKETNADIVFGLTATLKMSRKPVRLKAWSLTGPTLYQYPLVKGMEEKVLSKGVAIFVQFENPVPRHSNIQDEYINKIVENEERNKLISSIVSRAYKRGKYGIVLVDRIKHLERLSNRLDGRKIPHKIAAGQFKGAKLRIKDRAKDTKKFEMGKVRVIIANKVLKKGVDIKRVDVGVNATGRGSENDAIQFFGRGIRKHVDKDGLLLFDIYDIDSRNGNRNKKNWFAKAAKRRKRALKKIGIPVKDFRYGEDGHSRTLFKEAEKFLKESLKG